MKITQLQTILKHIGMYYTHMIGEKYIKETNQALLLFQRDNNLLPSGMLDNETKREIKKQVLKLKKEFNALGINVNDTYLVDDEMIMAIKVFQKRYNLTVNGIMRKKDFFVLNKALNEIQNVCIQLCNNKKDDKDILSSIERFLIINLRSNGIKVSKCCNERTVLIAELSSDELISISDNKGGELCNIAKNELNGFISEYSKKEQLSKIKININSIDKFNSAKKRDDLAKAISNALISILHFNQSISQV